MEAALRTVMKHMLDDYVDGLAKANLSSFPATMRNLRLKPKAINQELDDVPFNVDEGKIGFLSVSLGWMGNVDVEASGISVKLSFDARKAARLAMRQAEPGSPGSPGGPDEDLFLTNQPMAPPEPPKPCPPRFCPNHDTSEKRTKCQPHDVKCIKCGITYTTSYEGALLCPPCSESSQRCLICGKGAETKSTYIPAMTASAPDGAKGGPSNAKKRDSMEMPQSNSMQLNGSVMNTRLPLNMQQSPSMQQRGVRPTDSFPVNGGQPGPAQNKAYDKMQGQYPQPYAPPPVPAGWQGQAPMTNRRRGPPQQQDDDESFLDFLRNLTCNAVGMSDEDEYDMSARRRR
jgi:hypothetical protein